MGGRVLRMLTVEKLQPEHLRAAQRKDADISPIMKAKESGEDKPSGSYTEAGN